MNAVGGTSVLKPQRGDRDRDVWPTCYQNVCAKQKNQAGTEQLKGCGGTGDSALALKTRGQLAGGHCHPLLAGLGGTYPGCWWASPTGCEACRAPPGNAGSRMLAPRHPRSGWALGCLGRPSDKHDPPLDPFPTAPRAQFASFPLTFNHSYQTHAPPENPGDFISVHTCQQGRTLAGNMED